MEIENQDIQAFVDAVKSRSLYDFTNYSHKSLKRRLSKILIDYRISPVDLLERIREDNDFLERIVKDITVNTTELFRDPLMWHSLRYEILPIYQRKSRISIWHPGCSTGQEVYSMMILLNELGLLQKSSIFASDINQDVLEVARAGEFKYRFNEAYLENFNAVIRKHPGDPDLYFDVPYSKYFAIDKTGDKIQMNQQLCEKPTFKKHDLVGDPNPFDTIFDLIICRNVIIYFNYELQNKVFKLFLDNMSPGACLLLGAHESILGLFAQHFEKKYQAYFKK